MHTNVVFMLFNIQCNLYKQKYNKSFLLYLSIYSTCYCKEVSGITTMFYVYNKNIYGAQCAADNKNFVLMIEAPHE